MKRFIPLACAATALLLIISVALPGCGHHKRHKTNVAVVTSGSTAAIPTNIVVQFVQPQDNREQLLTELLAELRDYEDREEQSVNVVVEIDNDVTVDTDVTVEGDKIIVKPGRNRHIPRLYHWLRKWNKKHCDRLNCHEHPKPCDNEDDDDEEEDD